MFNLFAPKQNNIKDEAMKLVGEVGLKKICLLVGVLGLALYFVLPSEQTPEVEEEETPTDQGDNADSPD